MHEANEAAYASVRDELRTLFGAICVNKSADLVMAGSKVRCAGFVSLRMGGVL